MKLFLVALSIVAWLAIACDASVVGVVAKFGVKTIVRPLVEPNNAVEKFVVNKVINKALIPIIPSPVARRVIHKVGNPLARRVVHKIID